MVRGFHKRLRLHSESILTLNPCEMCRKIIPCDQASDLRRFGIDLVTDSNGGTAGSECRHSLLNAKMQRNALRPS